MVAPQQRCRPVTLRQFCAFFAGVQGGPDHS
jgi:hypothetical protein